MAIRARPYENEDDLRRMQALQQELWALEGPRVHAHAGDLAWWATMHVGREQDWKRQLWLDGDRCVAWAWLDRPSALDYEVHRDHRGGALHHEVLDWFEREAEGDGPLSTCALEDDDQWLGVLQERGYAYHAHELDRPLPTPS